MSSFSAEHKRVEDWYRQTVCGAETNPCEEDLTIVMVSTLPIRNETFDAEINRMLSSTSFDVYLKQKDDEKKQLADKVRYNKIMKTNNFQIYFTIFFFSEKKNLNIKSFVNSWFFQYTGWTFFIIFQYQTHTPTQQTATIDYIQHLEFRALGPFWLRYDVSV